MIKLEGILQQLSIFLALGSRRSHCYKNREKSRVVVRYHFANVRHPESYFIEGGGDAKIETHDTTRYKAEASYRYQIDGIEYQKARLVVNFFRERFGLET
ncbi:MAG: hypothetical protein ABW096_01865 [Candidatus Thiodiazotropha sp.]